ncbi:type I CRISPR-associated protein Cas7 [Bernardetia sp. OM2101]|uniref:type I CRISPR-associated protein Cas7 n=1 Tax=Bernardetia sp. OM2101 TaxID=3344876 RepID=UPI0035CEAED8
MSFKNRVFGCAIVRAINASYNADFSHQPRTLPDGKVYATDKAFKYLVKNYLKDISNEKMFYFKTQKEGDFNPRNLEETYDHHFPNAKKESKEEFAQNLLSCLDVRTFGATFAMKAKSGNVALSIHGTTQINHGINIWKENNIYSEQIMSPFANPKAKKNDKGGENEEVSKEATTLGRQSKLQEGHYLHHFSVNPKNLEEVVKLAGEKATNLTQEDIDKLKIAFRSGATYFDSSSKAGIDNEMLIWVQLKEDSKKVFPTFGNLIEMSKNDTKDIFDLSKLKSLLEGNKEDLEKIEIYYLSSSIELQNVPSMAACFDITSGKEIN